VDRRVRVVMYGRPGCHLCDDARTVISRVCGELGVGWQERSIDGDADLERSFGEQIPVTFVDDVRHDFWRVDEERLRSALARRPDRSGDPTGPVT
jgi:hypothetical protein